jgi:deazaflavin-dependent oxidoreductase (nitroreductase family)
MTNSDDELFGPAHVRAYPEILLLTTTGRRSGEERTTPLIHRTDDTNWVVVASKGGTPENPDWYENLLAQPDATIQVKAERIPVHASTAEGEERNRLWSRMTAVWPDYDQYQEKTDREIPIVVFERR